MKIWRKWQLYLCIVLFFNIVSLLYVMQFTKVHGYLPSPFLYDKSDTFMDLFNTLYWAYDKGRYTIWGSVYPPLNFLVLKIFTIFFVGGEYIDPRYMRDNFQFVIFGFFLIFLSVPAIVLKTRHWQHFKKNEKFIIYLIIVLSTPMLFALERGNMIIITPILLAFVLSRIGITRCILIAILINIKAYFAFLLIYYIARRNWKNFATCSLLSGLIFVITGLALDVNFLVFFTNLFNFSQNIELFSLREVMAMPSSVSAFSYVLKNPTGAIFASGHLNSAIIGIVVNLIEATKWTVIVFSLLALYIKSRQIRDAEIIALLVIFLCNLDIWVGGYTYILYYTLIPVFICMRANWFYIGIISFMAMPLDIAPILSDFIGEQYSYLTGSRVNVYWTLGVGSVIRPILNLALLLLLSCEYFGLYVSRSK